jgi:hypothetical protein
VVLVVGEVSSRGEEANVENTGEESRCVMQRR